MKLPYTRIKVVNRDGVEKYYPEYAEAFTWKAFFNCDTFSWQRIPSYYDDNSVDMLGRSYAERTIGNFLMGRQAEIDRDLAEKKKKVRYYKYP